MKDKTTPSKRVVNGVEYDPYSIDKLNRIPMWLKVVLIKFWAAGATYYFVGWGLGGYLSSPLDQMLVIGGILGLVIEYVINKFITYLENDHEPTKQYKIVQTSNVKSLFINLGLGILFTIFISYSYEGINRFLIMIQSLPSDQVPLPAGPIGFGLLFLLIEFIFLTIVQFFRKEKKG